MEEIVILCKAIAGLCMLLVLIATWRRFIRSRMTFSSVMVSVSSFSAIVELPFLLAKQHSAFDGLIVLDFALECALFGLMIIYNIGLLLIFLFLKRGKMFRLFLIMVGLFLAMLFGAAIVGSYVTKEGLGNCFFIACCGVLYITGMVFGFTYKEICVIVNIYLESGLCLLSALWVTWTAIKRFCHRKTLGNGVLMVSGIIYGLVYLCGFLWLCQHYYMPLNDAFGLCYRELVQLSKDYHTTYYYVNYAIFIILFLVTTIGNILLGNLIQKENQQG